MEMEIYKSDGTMVQMLTLKEMKNIPLSICPFCATLYCALPDTFFGNLISMCSTCKIRFYKKFIKG